MSWVSDRQVDFQETAANNEFMRGIVILSIFDWWYHSHGHSDIQLAHAFSKRMPVVFLNSIGMRFPRPGAATAPLRRITRKLRSAVHFLKIVGPANNIAVFTPIALPVYSGILGKANASLIVLQLRHILHRMDITNTTILITVPTYAEVAIKLRGGALIYNRTDLHSAFDGVNQVTVRRYEELLFRKSDVVLYANERLYALEKTEIAGRAVLIGHGIDAKAFSVGGPIAPELKDVARPRVGFFGELRKRSIDFDLIASVARRCPSIQFILGGTQLDDLGELREIPNIHILGPCPHCYMPARWRALDAAILPYRRSAWQEASEPIKLNEILAMGLSTTLTE
jgi:hypothetical protein